MTISGGGAKPLLRRTVVGVNRYCGRRYSSDLRVAIEKRNTLESSVFVGDCEVPSVVAVVGVDVAHRGAMG